MTRTTNTSGLLDEKAANQAISRALNSRVIIRERALGKR